MSYGLTTYDSSGNPAFTIDDTILTPLLSVSVPPNSYSQIDILPYAYDLTRLYASVTPIGSTSSIARTLARPVFQLDNRGYTVLSFLPASGVYAVYSLVTVTARIK